jgi:hypothetical protein
MAARSDKPSISHLGASQNNLDLKIRHLRTKRFTIAPRRKRDFLIFDGARSHQPPDIRERVKQHFDPQQSVRCRTHPLGCQIRLAFLNEHQNEFNQFNVLAYQNRSATSHDAGFLFQSLRQLHFMPDPIGDLVFNGVSSDVYRQSLVNGIQEDTVWRVGCFLRCALIYRQRSAPGQQRLTVARRSHQSGAHDWMRRSRSLIQAARPAGLSAPIKMRRIRDQLT